MGAGIQAEAKALGIVIDDSAAAALQKQIDACNGKRRKLRLSYADALRTVLEAKADPHGIAVRHAGAEALARTTIAVCVKAANGYVLGIQGCWADKPTPGRAWTELQPWMQDHARNVEKAKAWAEAKRATDRWTVTLGRPSKSASKQASARADGDALLAAILADPMDTQARLVYADWLTEQGDPRGELVTIQCQLAAGKLTAAKRAQLTKRANALLSRHQRDWKKEAMQRAEACELDRGFVGMVEMAGTAWSQHGAKLLAREPVTHLRIAGVTSGALKAIAGAAHTAKLRRIDSYDALWMKTPADAVAVNTFFKSPHVGQVRQIALNVSRERPILVPRAPVDTSQLFEGVKLPAVEILHCRIQKVPDSALESLATIDAPMLRELVVGIAKKQSALRAALKKRFPKAAIS